MRFSMAVKYIIRYVWGVLLALFALVALVALPIIAVIAIIYNSPFAIFFPSISSGETTQDVLSAYVAEFNREVNDELTNYSGYDTSKKIYVDFEGAGEPDNYCDILAVYMVKYGNGDTATDMTDKAKENLKSVFDDMCSYTITSRTDTSTDEEGNTTSTTVKKVNVKLKTYHDMISEYGFDEEEQEMLAELMKPENLAIMGYTGGGGDPGETLSPEQYHAIMDAVSDANGKMVVEYAFGKGMRESGQKIANTFRTFADKPEKEYGEKKFSKTERLAADVKQYQTDKAERETAGIGNVEAVNPVELAVVTEPEFQYGAEAFEAHQQETVKEMAKDKAVKNVPMKNGKSR